MSYGVGFASFLVTFTAVVFYSRTSNTVIENDVSRVRRDTSDTSDRIKFDELYDGTYSYSRFSATWSKNDSEFYFKSDDTTEPSIWRQQFNFDHFVSTGETVKGDKVSLVNKKWKSYCEGGCSTYYVSPDEKYVLFQKTNKQLWRRSYKKQFYIFDTETQKNIRGSVFDQFNPESNCLYAGWAPTGSAIAAVCGFNLYYINLNDGKLTNKQITVDGDEFEMLNGVCDWANEEENIKADNTIYWNQDSTAILFASYDLTEVDLLEYNTYHYDQFRKMESMSDRYPDVRKIKYAKAGTNPAKVIMKVFNTVSGKTEDINYTSTLKDQMVHVSRVSWSKSGWFVMEWINRDTTTTTGYICKKSSSTWECTDNQNTQFGKGVKGLEELSNAWVGFKGPFYPSALADEGSFFTIRTRKFNDDSWWQMVHVSPTEVSYIPTNPGEGQRVVSGIKIIQHSDDEKFIFYEYAAPKPHMRNLYAASMINGEWVETCLTCNLDSEHDSVTNMENCFWKSFVFQRAGNQEKETYSLFVNCRGPGIPKTMVTSIQMDEKLINGDEPEWHLYEENQKLQKTVMSKSDNWITRDYLQHKSDNWTDKPYNYELFYNKNIDKSADKKYALLVFVYGAPEYQNVDGIWTTDFVKAYLPSSYDVVTLLIDGRGSAYEGDKFMHATYKKLGYIEPFDQIEVTQAVIKQNKFIDPERVGIYGWSYGGYMTSHTLGRDAGNTFKCGVAVAPLADWRYYDTIYAERYMGDPKVEGVEHYKQGSIVEGHDPQDYANVDYTLIHGTDDDNVHFKNAVEMQKSLARAGVEYRAEFYADEDHSINSKTVVKKHVNRKILKHLLRCFNMDWRN